MFGIRVTGLPADITDRHLRVYFSNPRNGGGRIQNLYHPLPHSSAVILFDDRRVVDAILGKQHQLAGAPVHVAVVPKQVFRRVVVEVERNVSAFLAANPQLVDELQFIGEVNVNYQNEKQTYFLDGSWYKLEWTLNYLDTMLEAFQFNMEAGSGSRDSNAQNDRVKGGHRRPGEFRANSPPRNQDIKHPNIPVARNLKDEEVTSLPVTTGNQMPRYKGSAGIKSGDAEKPNLRVNKNKNVTPVTDFGTQGRQTYESKIYGKTVRSNLDDDKQNLHQTGSVDQVMRGAQKYNDDEGSILGAQTPYSRGFEQQDDSDSENEASFGAAYTRRQVVGPRKTRGIDVSSTDFGEVPLSFTFEVHGNLKVHVAMGNITKQTTDAIINPTTADLMHVYGVSRAIALAAGQEMQMECRRYVDEKGPLHYGGVMHTNAGGNLSEKVGFVLHTLGPHWSEERSEYSTHLLVCTYINCFQYADQKLWVQSLATPLISAGAFGFPLDVCIAAFYDAVLLFATRSSTNRHLKEINLVCFDQDSAMATIMIVQSLLDCDSSQAAVAATDRYWLCSSQYNFQAVNFGKTSEDTDSSDEGDSDKAAKTGNNKIIKQERDVQDKHFNEDIDKDKISTTRDDASDGKQKGKMLSSDEEDNNKEDVKLVKRTPEEKADSASFYQKHSLSHERNASDGKQKDKSLRSDEEDNNKEDVKFVERTPEGKADSASFYQKHSLRHERKTEGSQSDSCESDDGEINDMYENKHVDENLAKEDLENIKSGPPYPDVLDSENVGIDKAEYSKDDDENNHIQDEDQEPKNIGEENELDDKKYEEKGLEEEDKVDTTEDAKQPVPDREEKEDNFKGSVNKSSLVPDSEWSMVSVNDETRKENLMDENDSENETGKEH